MNVLSLFDGMSCGQIALNNIDVKITNYFASEIKQSAIKVTQHNYPNTIQLGDVTKLNGFYLPKIDLLMGGSPCQGFSIAGKQLNFNDSRSKLFFEFVRLLNETKPKYFLLENVKMKIDFQDIISEYLGVKPIKINSKLVSAQNRERLYWTNIPGVTQPKDEKIYLKDILNIDTNMSLIDSINRIDVIEKVKIRKYDVDIIRLQNLLRSNKKKTNNQITKELGVKKTTVDHWFRTDSCFSIPEPGIWYKLKECLSITDDSFDLPITEFIEKDNVFDMTNRVYKINGKAPTLTASNKKIKTIDDNGNIIILNSKHFERLQTVPKGYTSILSENKAMNVLGDGWTVKVIEHILKNIKEI